MTKGNDYNGTPDELRAAEQLDYAATIAGQLQQKAAKEQKAADANLVANLIEQAEAERAARRAEELNPNHDFYRS